MSVASRITQIEEHLRDIYDTLEIAGEDLTNINKNIININVSLINRLKDYLANGIDIVWENWEKIEEEGTELSLVDTIAGEMKISYKGNTYQETTGASPNPDYPQEVQTVSGRQEIMVAGKNLFDKDDSNMYLNNIAPDNNGLMVSASTDITATNYIRTLIVSCQPSTTYTIQKSASKTFFIYDSSIMPVLNTQTTYLSRNDTGNKSTITTSNNARYLIVKFYNTWASETVSYQDMIDSIQIEKGNQATTYEPYTGNTYEINLGKNLANINDIQVGKYWNGNNESTRASILNIPIKPNTQYTIVGSWTNSHITQIRVVSFANIGDLTHTGVFTGTFTSPQTANYVSIEVLADTTFTNDMLEGLQILFCLGMATISDYTPYKTPIELCKIGNYQDKIYKDSGKWYLEKQIGKVVLNGSESWSDQGNGAFATNIPDKYNRYGTDGLLCNYFHLRTGTSTSNYEGIDNDTTRIRVWNVGMTLADFKTWLSTHNTSVYYQLATPTTEQIEDTELLGQLNSIDKQKSFDEQTNIIATSDDLQIIMNVVALKDLT